MIDSIEKEAQAAGAMLCDVRVLSEFVAYHSDDAGADRGAAAAALRLISEVTRKLHGHMDAIETMCMTNKPDNGRYLHLDKSA